MEGFDLPERVADRYERDCLLGRGGMGSVWRVRDRWLGRTVAMKVIRADCSGATEIRRFSEEARIAAQLQHPGIPPVHDLGTLPDGRMYFTMQEVQGESLERHLQRVHRSWRMGDPDARPALRRLLDAFLRVCEAVAYAHERGVIHRDLKPANVMLGRYGEVFVLDWGLVRLVQPGSFEVLSDGPRATRSGAVTGTPAYMAPEQARGGSAEATSRSDVHALGATLYDLLCDRPPRSEPDVSRLLAAVAAGSPVVPPSQRTDVVLADEELDRICLMALAHDPAERYPDAGALAVELAAWLDGARQRDRALAMVSQADTLCAAAQRAEQGERERSAAAAATLAALPSGADPSEKRSAWALQDEARELGNEVRAAQTRAIQTLRAALTHAPDLPEAHDRLAALFHRAHLALEASGRRDEADAVASDLAAHDRLGRYAAYLTGTGAVSLATDPPGAEVHLHRVIERDRRLVPVPERLLGRTPLRQVALERGDWLLTLHQEGRHEVRYPIRIERCEHWDGVAPGEQEPRPVLLPRLGALREGDCYVPAGWSPIGDDAFESRLPLRRRWVDGFVIRRFPVTLGEYLAYLDALIAEGREDEAVAAEPRLGDADEPLLARGPDGRYAGVRTDRSGPGWDWLPTVPDIPIMCVDWHQATGYAAWRAARDGLPWRLPMEGEWQKAARGADPRRYPWGDHFEPAWCRMGLTASPNMVVPVEAYPTDESPYGVRGLAGNVSDWVLDGFPEPPGHATSDRVLVGAWDAPQRYVLGGTCGSGPKLCETAQRTRISSTTRGIRVGFRLIRDLG